MTETIQILNTHPWGILLAGFLGLVWGSFFNVCIYRIPYDIPVYKGRSKCPQCNKAIPWYYNIPVLSYLYLNGRTGCCGKRLSAQYPLVELTTGFTFAFLFWMFGFSPQFACYAVFASYLLIISVIDLHHRIIPDILSFSGMALGLVASLWTGDIFWWESLLGMFAGWFIFFAIAWLYEKFTGREGLGGGDVKMLAMLGAWLGIQSIPVILLVSTTLGSLVGIVWMVLSRKNFQAALPFGPFLALAAWIHLFWGNYIYGWIVVAP